MIEKALTFLTKGKTILYPTDTVWGIGCDATDESAVSKVYEIKKRAASKSLIILVDSIEMLQTIIKDIPKKTIQHINKISRPTSIIYANPTGLAKNVIAKDNTVAIRIVKDPFCQELIHKFGKPIVSTSANISGAKTPIIFSEIDKHILESVDYIINFRQDEICNKPSQIVKFTKDGELIFIRK